MFDVVLYKVGPYQLEVGVISPLIGDPQPQLLI